MSSEGSVRSVVNNIGLTLVRQVAVIALGLAFAIYIARSLGPANNGRYAVAVLLPTMLANMLNLGVGPANVYFIGRREIALPDAVRTTFRLWLLFSLAGTVLGALVVTLRAGVWFPGLSAPLLWLALAAFPPLLLTGYLSNLLQALQDFVRYNRMMVSPPFITLAAALLAVGVLGWGVFGALLATVIGSTGGLVIAYAGLRGPLRAARRERQDGYGWKCIGYGWKAHLSNILSFFVYRVDIFLLNLFLAPAAVGLYAVAVQVAERLWIPSQAVSIVLLPRLASLSDDKPQQKYLTALLARWMLLVSLIGAVLLALVSAPLIRLLFGGKYAGATMALLWLLPGIVLGSLARVLSNDLAARGRPDLNMWAALGVLAINVAANLILIPRMGIVGASISTTIAYSFHAAIKLYFYARLSGNHWWRSVLIPWGDWVRLRRSALGLLCSVKE